MAADTAFEVGRLYEPINRIADAVSGGRRGIFAQLPGLQAYYTMGARSSAGLVISDMDSGITLSQTGTVQTGYDGNGYASLGNGTNFAFTGGAFGITGLETFIEPALRGMTIGGWFMMNAAPATQAGLISKYGLSPQIGYVLNILSTLSPGFFISPTGTTIIGVSGTLIQLSQWHFLVGRFIPSTEVAIFVDGSKTANTTAIPVSCFASAQNMEIGRFGASNLLIANAKVRDVFFCASALPDALIQTIRRATAP